MRALNDMQITKVCYTACRAWMSEHGVRLPEFDRLSDAEKSAWLWTTHGIGEECVWLTGGDVHAIWCEGLRRCGWTYYPKYHVRARMHPWLSVELDEVYVEMFRLFGDFVLCGFCVGDKSVLDAPAPALEVVER